MTNWDKLWKNKLNKMLIKLNIKGNYYLNAKLFKEIVKRSSLFNSSIEIGSGTGRLSYNLSNKFKNCYILDKSQDALDLSLELTKKKNNIHSICCDIFNFETSDTFDMVASVGLVEHFPTEEMKQILEIQLKLTSLKGKALIAVPAYSPKRLIRIQKKRIKKKYGYQDPETEFKIENFLKDYKNSYQKLYIPTYNNLSGITFIIVLLHHFFFNFFRIDLSHIFIKKLKLDVGHVAVFIVNKN